jgi:3-oxoadipate enol-lactonase
MAAHVDDLEGLLEAHDVERPCWLVAAAAGAAIAAEYALRRPERVAGIVMCAPSLDAPVGRRQALCDRADRAARDGMRAIVDDALGLSWPPALRVDDESRARFSTYRSQMMGNDPAAYAHAARAFVDVALGDRLSTLSCACLVLAGSHDLQRPPESLRASTGAMPDVTFETLPTGHLMAVQSPVMVAARIAAFVPGAHP